MVIEGNYYEENFSYLRVRVKGCYGSHCDQETDVKSVRILYAESSINYEDQVQEKALEWGLDS